MPEDNKTIFSSEYKLHMPTERELIEAVEEENTDVADEEEQDLNSKVAEALDACLPEDDAEDFDSHELIDAVLAYFDTDDEKDYIKSIVCPEDESDRDESEDKE